MISFSELIHIIIIQEKVAWNHRVTTRINLRRSDRLRVDMFSCDCLYPISRKSNMKIATTVNLKGEG